MDGQGATGGPFDPVESRVEDADAAAQDMVLERLDVTSPDTDERLRVDRQARLGR